MKNSDLQDTLVIKSCPCCEEMHVLSLIIKRSKVMGISYQPKSYNFTRIFTCPVKDDIFQINIDLVPPNREVYENIEIMDIINTIIDIDNILQHDKTYKGNNYILYEKYKIIAII